LVTAANKILVAVSGNAQDEEIVDFACYQARRTRAKLYVVYVIEVKRELPLEVDLPDEVDRGEAVLQAAERVAQGWKQEVDSEVLQARDAGTAIVEEAERREVDLIVVGLRYRRKYDQYYIGSTVAHILRHAPSRVCVLRGAIS
jgi:nucleotide-binding universal stress UspA family protein